eukprot:TRINITY_DN23391_c0_g1_i2.p1 TRINITY_DN23391_c0_g1~~TRINITY_DN23391_c0_g1_i2.p1  ORF type:complete len:380 (-),score=50.59 TRINITY_DN23391_c0_g1_i2:197-1336(-)
MKKAATSAVLAAVAGHQGTTSAPSYEQIPADGDTKTMQTQRDEMTPYVENELAADVVEHLKDLLDTIHNFVMSPSSVHLDLGPLFQLLWGEEKDSMVRLNMSGLVGHTDSVHGEQAKDIQLLLTIPRDVVAMIVNIVPFQAGADDNDVDIEKTFRHVQYLLTNDYSFHSDFFLHSDHVEKVIRPIIDMVMRMVQTRTTHEYRQGDFLSDLRHVVKQFKDAKLTYIDKLNALASLIGAAFHDQQVKAVISSVLKEVRRPNHHSSEVSDELVGMSTIRLAELWKVALKSTGKDVQTHNSLIQSKSSSDETQSLDVTTMYVLNDLLQRIPVTDAFDDGAAALGAAETSGKSKGGSCGDCPCPDLQPLLWVQSGDGGGACSLM